MAFADFLPWDQDASRRSRSLKTTWQIVVIQRFLSALDKACCTLIPIRIPLNGYLIWLDLLCYFNGHRAGPFQIGPALRAYAGEQGRA